MTNVIRDIIQHDKQSKKVEQPQQQHRLIHDRGKRQKRFSTKKSEQTEWFQWPGPCNNDNNCPPNLYCVNGSCWHLLDKPIRIQQVHRQHDPSINAEEQKKSDISHLAIESLYRSVDELPVYTEYTRQRRFGQPIRIELYLARAVLHDECSQDSHCGHRMICCRKRWYDLSADSGTGYFCLPDCGLTKKVNLEIHEANGSIPNDIIYD
uniref:WAP domain-containing protein n=1 Tax=Elaeophora elaphi TaxID=1147741 RepID=A0A0R3RJ15_9BILA